MSSISLLSSICPNPAGEAGAPPGRPDWGCLHGASLHEASPHPAPQCKHPCAIPSMVWKLPCPPCAILVPTPLGRERGWEEEEEEDEGREERAHMGRKQGPGAADPLSPGPTARERRPNMISCHNHGFARGWEFSPPRHAPHPTAHMKG